VSYLLVCKPATHTLIDDRQPKCVVAFEIFIGHQGIRKCVVFCQQLFHAFFFGLPPFLPFLRTARFLRSLVFEPPSLPSATAAGFLGIAKNVCSQVLSNAGYIFILSKRLGL